MSATGLRRLVTSLIVVLGSVPFRVLAAPVNHGNFSGSNVSYKNVTEATSSEDPDILFGAPVSSGDVLDFDPLGFAAQSQLGGVDFTNSTLTLEIEALPSRSIGSIQIGDVGDANLTGIGTDATGVSVGGNFTLRIRAVDGVDVNPINFPSQPTYSPFDGTYRLVTEGGGSPFYTTPWMSTHSIDIDQQLAALNFPFTNGATKVTLTINLNLIATSESASFATITRKDFGIMAAARPFGDYDNNGSVDAADYVVLRNGLGTTYSQLHLDNWRSHFGDLNAAASAAGPIDAAAAAIPEPMAWQYVAALIGVVLPRLRRHDRSNPPK